MTDRALKEAMEQFAANTGKTPADVEAAISAIMCTDVARVLGCQRARLKGIAFDAEDASDGPGYSAFRILADPPLSPEEVDRYLAWVGERFPESKGYRTPKRRGT